MKKLIFLACTVFSLHITGNSQLLEELKQRAQEAEKKLQDPRYLKSVLRCKYVNPKFNPGALAAAKEVAQKAHENLENELSKFNHMRIACKSLDKRDAFIVHECARIEQQKRNHITGSKSEGIFFDNACPCDFYKKLTDEELAQLERNTKEDSLLSKISH